MSRTILGITAAAALALVALGGSVAQAGFSGAGGEQLSGPFLGTYTGKLTSSQAAALGDHRMTGRFRLVLRANGTYTDSNPLDGPSHGKLAVLSGKRLRFYADNGCTFGGFERPQGGIYRWSLNGRKLTLRLVSEGACTGRTQSLAWVVWNRK
jgi:hypothetical protein